jgi:hypothetical protein
VNKVKDVINKSKLILKKYFCGYIKDEFIRLKEKPIFFIQHILFFKEKAILFKEIDEMFKEV